METTGKTFTGVLLALVVFFVVLPLVTCGSCAACTTCAAGGTMTGIEAGR